MKAIRLLKTTGDDRDLQCNLAVPGESCGLAGFVLIAQAGLRPEFRFYVCESHRDYLEKLFADKWDDFGRDWYSALHLDESFGMGDEPSGEQLREALSAWMREARDSNISHRRTIIDLREKISELEMKLREANTCATRRRAEARGEFWPCVLENGHEGDCSPVTGRQPEDRAHVLHVVADVLRAMIGTEDAESAAARRLLNDIYQAKARLTVRSDFADGATPVLERAARFLSGVRQRADVSELTSMAASAIDAIDRALTQPAPSDGIARGVAEIAKQPPPRPPRRRPEIKVTKSISGRWTVYLDGGEDAGWVIVAANFFQANQIASALAYARDGASPPYTIEDFDGGLVLEDFIEDSEPEDGDSSNDLLAVTRSGIAALDEAKWAADITPDQLLGLLCAVGMISSCELTINRDGVAGDGPPFAKRALVALLQATEAPPSLAAVLSLGSLQ